MMEYGVPTPEPWKIKVPIDMELKFMGMTQVLWLRPGTGIHLGSFHAKSLDD